MDAPDQTDSNGALAQVAERALSACRKASAENEMLRNELAATRARATKAVAQAQKAIPMLRSSQAKLKQALAANASLEQRVAVAQKAALDAAERARAAEEAAQAAVAHARTADDRRRRAEEHASAIESKEAIEGRLKRMRGGQRRRAA